MFFLISDCGVASADLVPVIPPAISILLPIPVTLFLFLCFILYQAIKFIIYLRTNPDAINNARIEGAHDDMESTGIIRKSRATPSLTEGTESA
ncbi:MAG: hypothetical protein BWY32_01840 [bacterium ADurb.Bin243]|nr:MAG: hypothetical protein BWY32_01840 [bacterium ADurb.Bin243]HOD40900.1 hypothetical protein [Candidatus Wallbacteria bacterium]